MSDAVTLKLPFSGSDVQWQFLESTARFALASGGFGSGKSHVLGYGAAALCVENAGLRGGLIGADFGRLSTDVLPVLYKVLDGAVLSDGTRFPITHEWLPAEVRGSPPRSLIIGAGWLNTILDVRSMDDPESCKGPTWAFAVGDEITLWPRYVPRKKELVWGIVESRLRMEGGNHRFLGAGTPEGKANWTMDPGLFKTAPDDEADYIQWLADFACIRMPTYTNPVIKKEFAEGLWRRMDPEQRMEKILGIDAAGVGGMAYPYFDRAKNCYPLRYDPFRGPLLVGLDFNVNPMTAVLCQHFRGDLLVFNEIYMPNSTTAQMGRKIVEKARGYGIIDLERIEIRPDASGRARKTTGEPDFDALRAEGLTRLIYPHEGNPRVSLRLNAVNGAFYNQNVWIDRGCKNLIRECTQTAKNDAGEIVKTPLLGQITDALGYVVVPLFPIYERGLGYARAA